MTLSNEQLLERFPLHPIYKGVGTHHLLLYAHHYERGKFLVARSEAALRASWLACFKHDEGGLPIAYVSARIVNPPDAARLAYAKSIYHYELDTFASSVCGYLLDDYRKLHNGKRPKGLSSCTTYLPTSDPVDTNKTDPKHYNCGNCHGRYVADWETLYLKHYEAVFQQDPGAKHKHHMRIYESAPTDPAKPVYYISDSASFSSVYESFENTSTVLSKLTPEMVSSLYFNSNIYFFFQGTIVDVTLDPTWTAPVKALRKEADENKASRSKKFKQEQRAAQLAHSKIVETIFGESP